MRIAITGPGEYLPAYHRHMADVVVEVSREHEPIAARGLILTDGTVTRSRVDGVRTGEPFTMIRRARMRGNDERNR